MLNNRQRILLIYPGIFIFLGIFLFISNLIKIASDFDSNKKFAHQSKFSYEIYYSQNKILTKLSRKYNINDEEEEISNYIKNAFISSEDKRFLRHNGIDIIGSSRALITNIQSGYIKEGGSTITQQVSRLIFLNNDVSFSRKIKEIIISIIMDYKYSKNKILKIYLNEIYLGEGAYGINEAAQIYFGKLINELTLSEIAMLAGLAPAPNYYSPYKNYKLAINQRDKILRSMFLDGYINKESYEKSLKEEINLLNKNTNLDKVLIDFILHESRDKVNINRDYDINDHLKIKSSIFKEWQDKAQKLSKKYLPEELEVSLISINSDTGLIRSMVSSRDPKYNQFNRTTSAIRSLGSTFKIVPYCLALLEGKKLDDKYNDTATCWDNYCPQNYSNIYHGEVSLVDAFKKSSNIVPIKIANEFGIEKIINLANLFGLGYKQKFKNYLSLAIGSYGDSLLNITNAYSTINNKGEFIKPSILENIKLKSGKLIWENKFKSKKIINEEIANNLNFLLEKSVSDGNGIAASIRGKKVFGKTGTSDLNRDLWFIGSIKNLTTGIWIGFDDNRSTDLSSGTSANLWKIYINEIKI